MTAAVNVAAFAGLRVLDLAWVVAGPMIGRTLAEYGATVVRVESAKRIDTARVMGPFPDGRFDPTRSALYDNCNVGKLGLALDLATPDGQAVCRDLVRWADVVIESFAPGQMARWGLDYPRLRELRPDIVMLSTSLMGQSGPFSGFAGFGNVGAAVAGFQQLVGWPDELPVGPFGPYTDYVGPRFGLLALLGALDHRRRTGEGCYLDVSQAEAGMQLLAPQMADFALSGHDVTAQGNRDPAMAPHGVFACRAESEDETPWIALAVRDDAEWQRLARRIGGAALAEDTRFTSLAARKTHEDVLEEQVSTWAARLTLKEVMAAMRADGIPAHPVSSSDDFWADPQLAARGHFVRLPRPPRPDCIVEASRFSLSGTPAVHTLAAPTVGRDNVHVLRDLLGYDNADIERLTAAQVLG